MFKYFKENKFGYQIKYTVCYYLFWFYINKDIRWIRNKIK